ncbi:DNA gyrase subunit A [Pyramidobacter sp. YE332]|uniref:DNA gyrase subunit A n=1 Tax=unclassified Pyramidobacter TaxID=2632171 RepID=UPI00098F3B40|nr:MULTISPECIES: DNA gyrase subunit A [unclassified Pyramidobacter]OON87593.1 DNA gyrase subunit A [Pyramidobacter sp. C12-8]WOL38996.1 DNA gyrase subunit A [Pyramidobacter sp. YE332]
MEEQAMGRVIPNPLVPEIKRSYLDYAMSVIVGRALPDARDGLKPVQRRVLYGMLGLGIRHNQAYKKSARVVGEVMGKYHPHGDASIYDTMVRLAQPWNLRYPLVDGQGNFGSVDGDGAAAMRYTEARFAELGELMLQDIDEDTVDWGPNFDESLKEPLTLPSLVPNLLVNGSTGIAVGMATNMPPHNLGEVVDALCCLIDHPEAELGELMDRLPGPDFPTGGIIMGREGIVDAYRTGRGKIIVRGRCVVEEGKRRTSVVITEIPYMVNKTTLIEGIAKCVQEHSIDGVADLRDESDRQGLRIVLDLNRDGDPELVQRQLYNRTMMQSTFGVINLTLVGQRPVELGLKSMLEVFLDYRRGVVRRRTAFRLAKAQEREHIIEGLCRALDMIDEVIRIIRGAQTAEEASRGLIEQLQFSEKQAQAILDMRLQRLTGLERDKLMAEMAQLLADIARYQEILADAKVLDGVIRDELTELRHKFGDKRRTEIRLHVESTSDSYEDLMPEENIVITLSKDGYLRRSLLKDYNVQNRGGKGRRGANLHEEDQVAGMVVTTTHNDVLLFTSRGRVFAIKGHMVPETKSGKGRKVEQFISLSEGETVVEILGRFPDNCSTVVLITRRGIAKRMDKSELQNLTRAGRQIMTLDDGDDIARIRCTNGLDDLFLVSAMGRGLRISEDEIRTMGRSARGVKAMKLGKDDEIISCEVIAGDSRILLVSQRGIGKITSYDEFSVHHRATGGQRAMRIGDRTGRLAVANTVFPGDEVALMTAGGNIIRLAVDSIPQLGRDAAGSILIRPENGDEVANVSLIHKEDLVQSGSLRATEAAPAPQRPVEPTLPFGDDDDTGGLEFEDVPGAVLDAPDAAPTDPGREPEKED